jgi:hypothetical protein
MDEYLRQLTHDNQQLNNQWPDISDRLRKFSINTPDVDQPIFKVKSLDALVDYVLADTEEVEQIKRSFIDITIKNLTQGPIPSLDELVRIFCRVLEITNTNNLLNYLFLQSLYSQFRLGERLSSGPSVDLIERIFQCLKKQDFYDRNFQDKMQENWKQFFSRNMFSAITSDANKLNYEQTMTRMQGQFQQLYR